MKVYLDNSATMQPLPQVAEVVAEALRSGFGNPSSGHRRGQDARREVETARSEVGALLGCAYERIVFTSGATEANHAVLDMVWKAGFRLITSEAEHPSTVGVFSRAPDRWARIPVNPDGQISLEGLELELARENNAFVAVSWVNGETGVIQPVEKISLLARCEGARLLLDAAQAVGRLPRAERDVTCDYMTVSAHKMGGPQGVGALAVLSDAPWPTIAAGGGQEGGRRSGTENVPGIAGFGVACSERLRDLDADLERVRSLRDRLEARLLAAGLGITINGADAPRVATNTNVTIPGVDGMALVARCDAAGVTFSQVSACSTGRPEPSPTLTAMGLDEEAAFSSVRLSVSPLTKDGELDYAVDTIVAEARKLGAGLGRAA